MWSLEFGLGSKGFSNSDWWSEADWAQEKSPKGIYEIDFTEKFRGYSWDKAKKEMPKGWDFSHTAVLAEAILIHLKETGERLLEKDYSWTYSLTSYGSRVFVGYFGDDGLVVDYCIPYWVGGGGLRICLTRWAGKSLSESI